MADQPVPLRRYVAASAVALAPSFAALLALHWSGTLAGRPTLLAMRPGTRVVSHSFTMEDWEPDQTIEVGGRTAFFWVVPAKVEGTWSWHTDSGDAELSLKQSFQKISGSLKLDGKTVAIQEGKLEGDRISFVAGSVPRWLEGRVVGNAIEGITKASTGFAVTKTTPAIFLGGWPRPSTKPPMACSLTNTRKKPRCAWG